MLEALPSGQPPRLVGPYRLLARLGAGGMGEVHLACRVDAPTADPYRMVAVKTVREDLEVDWDFRTRFRREITAARAVNSPYAALLVDADADAAVPWLATEYVPGPSLAEAVTRAGALPVDAVRALGAALARALESVHAAKVLHRDLKPANVLLGAAGPKLIDFGIAQAFEATALTSTGLVVGSPGFMSPEHLIGSRAVVPASDVFCLGAVLAFAASGRGPFHDEEMASVVFRISRADAELDAVPQELRPVVERCLRLDPAERPSAAELVELLGAEVPAAFPWPGGVLSLLAEYGDSARRIGEAAASGAGVADLPTLAPQVPYSPTAAGVRPAVAEARERRRPWGRITAAAVTVAVLATVGVALLDRTGGQGGQGEQGGSAGATPSGGTRSSSASPGTSAAPAALDHVIQPFGGEGHAGDFGKDGSDRSARPAGWSPWATGTDAGVGPCALGPEILVCSGDGGAAVALRAADGKKLWSKPSTGDQLQVGAQYPAVVGDVAWMTGRDGLVGYRLSDGKEVGRLAAPGGVFGVKGTDLHDGVLYTTYVDTTDFEKPSGLVTAVPLSGAGAPKERWRQPISVFPESPVASGGQVYVPGNGTVLALDARTGKQTARAQGLEGCYRIVVGARRVLCPQAGQDGVEVLDARTLKRERTVGRGTQVTAVAVNAAGVMALSDGDTLSTYDLKSGAERWSRDAEGEWVAFAGDRVLTGSLSKVTSVPVTDPPASVPGSATRTFNAPEGTAAVEGGDVATGAVAAGGAVFIGLASGVVVSGYAP
ncbi:protein kinase [Streptomyces sp. NPDC056463]|uniref:protein kinase domain-containing protein n=1 Tax=Streptomyces sp. NPDC056463 TaxID=3345827 RepID=UPI00369AEEAA